MDTLSESHIMVRFGVFRKRSVFFFFFSFELPGDAELHSYFCGCEVHSMHDAAYLWPDARPSASLTAYTIHAVLSGGSANCPIFHVFAAPVIFTK